MGSRNRARQSCLQILYQIELSKVECESAIEDYFSFNKSSLPYREFSDFLVKGVLSKMPDIDKIISKYAKNWAINRMAVIDRNILRMGVFELIYADDIPPRVSINESVELAKMFGDIDSPKFINGILDSVFREEAGGGST